MQSQSGVTVVVSNGILRPIGNQVGENGHEVCCGCTGNCTSAILNPLYCITSQMPSSHTYEEGHSESCVYPGPVLLDCRFMNHIPPSGSPCSSSSSFFSSLPPQVTLPWALAFAVLGVLCRIPGVLYQSSEAGVTCGRFMAHVCLVQVGGGQGVEGGGRGAHSVFTQPSCRCTACSLLHVCGPLRFWQWRCRR